jgi:hypothetical protein
MVAVTGFERVAVTAQPVGLLPRVGLGAQLRRAVRVDEPLSGQIHEHVSVALALHGLAARGLALGSDAPLFGVTRSLDDALLDLAKQV